MELTEAIKTLHNHGFIVEGTTIPTGKCIVMIYDYVNNFGFAPYKGFVGENEFVAETKEAKIYDTNDMESIKADVKDCLEYAIMDDLDDLLSEVYIVPIKNGKPDINAKQRMDV